MTPVNPIAEVLALKKKNLALTQLELVARVQEWTHSTEFHKYSEHEARNIVAVAWLQWELGD